MIKSQPIQLPFLDGLRGYAAVWVLISHALILAGANLPIVSQGDWAVDVFIIMSGFLMTLHYHYRRGREPWESPKTWGIFWLRRFWRIAPLYYVILAIAIILSSHLGQCRTDIAEIFPASATDLRRYSPGNPINILMHISFLFGVFPQFAFATPLPDWSIGLEVQFYAVFPFIMLALEKLHYTWLSLVFCLLSWLAQKSTDFPMPSFLPLKLTLFMIGILVATAYASNSSNKVRKIMISLALAISLLSGKTIPHSLFLLIIVALLTSMLFWNEKNPFSYLVQGCSTLLGNKLATLLADLSYSAYLIHLLIMLPMAAWLIQFQVFLSLPNMVRGISLALLTAIPTYSMAMLSFQYIEKPGITAGKQLVKQVEQSR